VTPNATDLATIESGNHLKGNITYFSSYSSWQANLNANIALFTTMLTNLLKVGSSQMIITSIFEGSTIVGFSLSSNGTPTADSMQTTLLSALGNSSLDLSCSYCQAIAVAA
jgi:hypothetical protein